MTTPSDTESLSPWYVTGFAEGEGTFTFSRNGRHHNLYFGLKQTGVDRSLLEMIQTFWSGIGKIYPVRARTPRRLSGFSKAACYYRVCRLDQLPRVAHHFEHYPLHGSKRQTFEIWREMLHLKARYFRRRPPLDELEQLAVRLSASVPRNARWELKEPGGESE